MDRLREQLAAKGIYPASDQKVMYRYQFEDVLIDFIPFTSNESTLMIID